MDGRKAIFTQESFAFCRCWVHLGFRFFGEEFSQEQKLALQHPSKNKSTSVFLQTKPCVSTAVSDWSHLLYLIVDLYSFVFCLGHFPPILVVTICFSILSYPSQALHSILHSSSWWRSQYLWWWGPSPPPQKLRPPPCPRRWHCPGSLEERGNPENPPPLKLHPHWSAWRDDAWH